MSSASSGSVMIETVGTQGFEISLNLDEVLSPTNLGLWVEAELTPPQEIKPLTSYELSEISKATGICPSSIEKLSDILAIDRAKSDYHSAVGGSQKKYDALRRWKNYSFKVMKIAETTEEIQDAYLLAPAGGRAEKLAVAKLMVLFIRSLSPL